MISFSIFAVYLGETLIPRVLYKCGYEIRYKIKLNVKVLKHKFKASIGYHFGAENIKCRCKMYTLCK